MARPNDSRRDFLKKTAAASAGVLGFPYFVPSSVLGQGAVAPSNRIVMACIGTNGQGRGLTGRFMGFPEVQMVAMCDVDARHLEEGRKLVNKKYENEDCRTYRDFRELLGRQDIDAVIVGTPDHWHALISVAAADAGKDIYCEKPLANSVAEGRAICEAVRRNQRILQTGTQERSGNNVRRVAEIVRNGALGKVHTVRINLPCDDGHHVECRKITHMPPEAPVPEHLDYDFWLGHTPVVPYIEQGVHFFWRFRLAYGGGEMTDRGAHVIDLAQLCLDRDDTCPVEYVARGVQNKGSLYDAFWDYTFENTYADGVKLIGSTDKPRGFKLEGERGWIFVHIHGQQLEASREELLQDSLAGDIRIGRSPGHPKNFLESVRSRRDPVATAEIGHRTGTICHLNNIAMLTGRPLKFDPVAERITNDAEANSLLAPVMRSPWRLQVNRA